MSQAGIANAGAIPPPPGSVTDLQGQDGVTVAPNGSGIIFVAGAVVAAGTTPFTTTGNAGTSTETWNIQLAQAFASSAANRVGLASFNSAEFTVDANGYVSLAGGGLAVDSFAMQTGTSPVVPTGAGLVTFNGAVVAAGTNPVRTDGTGANTMALEVQISQAIASTNAANIGLAAFNSANFTVDANGFVTLVNGGDLHITPFIVSASGITNGANFTTIQAALTAANAAGGGIVYVQPGSYTENLTLFANTEVVGTPGNSDAGTAGNTVIITGVHTPPTTGSFTFANVRLVSATDIFNSASAGSASLVLENAFIQITNGFLFNLPNWTGTFVTYNLGEGSTNNGMVNNTGGATCFFISATHGAGTGQTMVTSGPVVMQEIDLNCPWNAQTGTTIACDYVIFTHTVTCSNNSTGTFNWCRFSTGATAALTMSSSAAINMYHGVVDSSNNPAISGAGAGTFTYNDIIFLNNAALAGTLTTNTKSWQPYSRAIAATDGTKVGTCAFNSAQFTVDANGFVSSLGGGFPWIDQATSITLARNTGYFVTAATTQTLPAAPSQGDVVKIICDTASAVVVTANTGQTIRLSSSASSTAGTFTNTARGDALELIYRAATTQWIALNAVGNWTVA